MALLLGQVLACGLGFCAPLVRRVPFIGKIAMAIWYFMVLNAALLVGTFKYVTGRAAPVWQRTSRSAEVPNLDRGLRSRTAKAVAGSKEDSPAA